MCRKNNKIIHQNKDITEEKDIANTCIFNQYIWSIGKILVRQIRNTKTNNLNSVEYNLYQKCKESMFLHPVIETEVLKAIDSLQTNKAIGDLDNP